MNETNCRNTCTWKNILCWSLKKKGKEENPKRTCLCGSQKCKSAGPLHRRSRLASSGPWVGSGGGCLFLYTLPYYWPRRSKSALLRFEFKKKHRGESERMGSESMQANLGGKRRAKGTVAGGGRRSAEGLSTDGRWKSCGSA